MANKKRKNKRMDRRQRWAAIIALVLAVAMALSAIGAYAGHLLSRGDAGTVDPGQQVDPEAMREYCLERIASDEKYIEEHGPKVGVLSELCECYRLLLQMERSAEEADEAAVAEYESGLKRYSRDLVELEPDKPQYRLDLLKLYRETGEDDDTIAGEIKALRKVLRKKADPGTSLELIRFMKSSEQPEKIINDEIARLKDHFKGLTAEEKMTGIDRYYYAVLLGDHLEKRAAALEQLDLILETESPEGELYKAAEYYREVLQEEKEETE